MLVNQVKMGDLIQTLNDEFVKVYYIHIPDYNKGERTVIESEYKYSNKNNNNNNNNNNDYKAGEIGLA